MRHGPAGIAKRMLLRLVMRLPAGWRGWVVRRASPTYSVGALGFVVDEDRLLLVRLVYRAGWAAPGGLVGKGESPADAVVRELREEVGIEVTTLGPPVVDVDPTLRAVTAWFRCALVDPATADSVGVGSYELDEVAWFPLADLPPDLQPETRRGAAGLRLA